MGQTQRQGQTARTAHTTGAGPPRVLLVDDDEAMLESCPQVLERAGFTVTAVSDGMSALEVMRREGADVLIVDLKMPGMSGQEVFCQVKEIDPEAVVVVITGYPELSSAVEMMKAGAYDFLPKPFGAEELRIITKRAFEKRKLALALAAAERERQRMRDNFVAMVSHQLKSPAATLKECIDAAIESPGSQMPPQSLELLRRAAAKAQLLLDLMDDWLTLARAESGGLAVTGALVAVRGIVQQAIEAAQQCPEHNDVAVRLDHEGPDLQVRGDPEALQELFTNLIDNALRYTPDGGQVVVEIRADNGNAVVSVHDTGPGIPQQEMELVFEPFFRGEPAKKKHGTGLGLAIVKRIAEAHGGRVTVTSKPGCGTTFRVHLPAGEKS